MIIKDYGQVKYQHPDGCLITDSHVYDPILKNVLSRQLAIGGWITTNIYRASTGQWYRNGSLQPNLLTNGGRDAIHALAYTNTSAGTRGAGFLAVTEDTAAAAAGDTTLASEITTNGLARADVTTKTHTGGTNSTLFDHTYTASGTFTAVQKCATFTASSAGTMFHEGTFTSAALVSGDKLQIQYTLNLG
jgi:hypothetical protein